MTTYGTLKEKLCKKRQSFLYDLVGGRGSTWNTEVSSGGLVKMACAAMIGFGTSGCANSTFNSFKPYTTNLAESIKGDNVTTAKYNTERFSMDGITEYVINGTPKTFELPNKTVITTDSILKIRDTFAKSNLKDLKTTFKQKKEENIYAVVPVDFSEDGSKLYLANPNSDGTDTIILPPRFNMPERKIPEGFNVEKVKIIPIDINQTLQLPGMGESYAFVGKFPVYSDKSLNKKVISEPIVIMSVQGTESVDDYTNNTRGLEGKLHALVRLPAGKIKTVKRVPVTADATISGKTKHLQNTNFYTVKKNDFLVKIAKKNNTTLKNILTQNPDLQKRKNFTIYPGEKIKISE